ncbi:MAG: DUF721 domain-containing protein [Flavobacteriales bacterium]|nr:DUF721 domain-containing protein [Flavobacteriales bacterium]
MPRKSNEQPLGDLIKDVIRAYGLQDKMREMQMKEAWEKMVGKAIARQTGSMTFKDGILTIVMDSGVLKEEFDYQKSVIKDRLNEALEGQYISEVKVF